MSNKLRKQIRNEFNNNQKNIKEGFLDQANDTGTINQLEWHINDDKRKNFVRTSGCSQKVILIDNQYYYITQFCDALIMQNNDNMKLWLERYKELNILQSSPTNYSLNNGNNKLNWSNCLSSNDESYPIIKIIGNYPTGSNGMFLPPKLENSYVYVGLNLDLNNAFNIIKFTNKQDIEDQKYKCINLHEVARNYRTGEDYLNGNFLKIDDSVFRLKTQPETKEECFKLMQKINAVIIIKKYINSGIASNSIDTNNPDWDVFKFKKNIDDFLADLGKLFIGDKLPEDEFMYFTFGKGGICTNESTNMNGAKINQGCSGIFDGTTSNVTLQEAFTSNEDMDLYKKNYIKSTDWIRDSKIPKKPKPVNPADINKGKRIKDGGAAGGAGSGSRGLGGIGHGGKPARWQTDQGQYICKNGTWSHLYNFCTDGGGDRALFFTKKPETLNKSVDIWPTFRYRPFEQKKVPMGCFGDYAPFAADGDAEKAFNSAVSAEQKACEEDMVKHTTSWIEKLGQTITGGGGDDDGGGGGDVFGGLFGFQNEKKVIEGFKEGIVFGGSDGWGGGGGGGGLFGGGGEDDDGLPYTNGKEFNIEGCKRYKALAKVKHDNYNFWDWWPKATRRGGALPKATTSNGRFNRTMSGLGNHSIQNCEKIAKSRGFDIWSLQAYRGGSYNSNGSFKSGNGECFGQNINVKGSVYSKWHPGGHKARKPDGYGNQNGIPGPYSTHYGVARNNAQCNRLGQNGPGWVNKVERSNINLFNKDKCGGNADDVAEGNVRKIYLCPQYDASNLGKYVFIDMYYGIHFINNSHRIFYNTLGQKLNLNIVTFKGITYGNKNDDFDIRRSSGYYLYDNHDIGIKEHNAIDSYEWHNIITSRNTEGFTVENFSQEYNMDAKNKKLQEENYNILNRLTLRNATHSTDLKKQNNKKNNFIKKQSKINQKKTDQAVSLHRIVSSLDEGFIGGNNIEGFDAADRLEKRLKNFFNNETTYNALHEQTALDVKSKQAWLILWASLVIMSLSFKFYIMSKK